MKKIFYLAAAVIAVSSCAKQEVVDAPKGSAIGFDTYVGKAVRAGDVTTNTLDAMYVYGTHGEVVDFDATEVTGGNGSWEYSPLRYWISDAQYYFAATAPQVNGAAYEAGELRFDYTVDGDTDLVIAANAAYTATESNPVVQFTFKHALSKVQFTFNSEWDKNSSVVVSDITLTEVNNAGSVSASNTATVAPAWTSPSGAGNYAYGTLAALENTNNEKSVAADPVTKYLLPQTLSEATLTFTVTVTTEGVDAPKTKTVSAQLPTSSVAAWEIGKVYNYNVTINAENVFDEKPILFGDVTVDVWGEPVAGGDLADGGSYSPAE